MRRFSKKRQAILDCLCGTTCHPTADWIYTRLKPQYPDLSVGTVYRNLRQLKEEGVIRSMGIISGQERFDANTTPHPHAVCRKCGKTIDLDPLPIPQEVMEEIRNKTGFSVSEAVVQFTGLCPACRQSGTDAPVTVQKELS